MSTDDSIFFDLGAVKYTARPTTFANVLPEAKEDGPVAILPIKEQETLDGDWLKCLFDGSKDDVLTKDFVNGVVLQDIDSSDVDISSEAEALLKSWGNDWIIKSSTSVSIPPGAYLLRKNALWQVLRLYDDHQGAFLVSMQGANEDGAHEVLNDGKHGWSCCSLAVPSRLTKKATAGKPFVEWRIAVKDAFDIKGMKTSLCNKAYLELYSPVSTTAPSILHVIEGGSCILGKTKLSSFLSREEASESVDFQAPWNPRADGYQTTGGSSSGSTAAVAAYDWIDIGIGTDTYGSIRRPAQCNGVFGLRPSQGVFSQDGMFTVFKDFDVPGIFARDLHKLGAFATKWYGASVSTGNAEHLPPSIVLPLDFLPEDDTPQKKIVLDVVKDLESFLEVRADRVNLCTLWAQDPPNEAYGQGLHEYLDKVGRDTFLYANYQSGAAFRDRYFEIFNRKPFISKFVQWRWDVGSRISREEHEEAMRRMKVYKEWFLGTVMQVGERNSFVVMQSEDVSPKYRDDPPPSVPPNFLHHTYRR
ncbi:MAG: hypothetical protein Q9222_005310 [Ikaeria aurantiellina]